MPAHIRLLKQPNKIHICVPDKPKDYIKFMKMYCALIVTSPDTYSAQAGDETRTFSIKRKRISKVATITLEIHID